MNKQVACPMQVLMYLQANAYRCAHAYAHAYAGTDAPLGIHSVVVQSPISLGQRCDTRLNTCFVHTRVLQIFIEITTMPMGCPHGGYLIVLTLSISCTTHQECDDYQTLQPCCVVVLHREPLPVAAVCQFKDCVQANDRASQTEDDRWPHPAQLHPQSYSHVSGVFDTLPKWKTDDEGWPEDTGQKTCSDPATCPESKRSQTQRVQLSSHSECVFGTVISPFQNSS
jgi:hypothetical protein